MSKNILYFTRTMGVGGTEKVILQLCESQKKSFDKIIVCSCGGVYEEKLLEMNVKHYQISDIENKNILNIIRTFWSLRKIIRKEDINIIHTHHRMAALYTKLLQNFHKFSFVHTAHNTFYDKKLLTKFALSNAKIIAVGEKVKENLVDFYQVGEEYISVIYNAIPEASVSDNIEMLSTLKNKGHFLIGNIGRLSEQKGMEYFIRALPDVVKKYSNIKAFIIGDGELKDMLEKMVIELNLEKNVIFLGYRDDVINLIRHLDLIVLSSLWEGLPLTPIEVFSQRRAIIATNVDGTPEIIVNDYNGILVEPKNSDLISTAIIKVIENNDFKNKIANNGYKTYQRKFSIEEFNKKYNSFYSKLFS